MNKRVEWSKYVPVTRVESKLLDYIEEHQHSVVSFMSNDFQKKFILGLLEKRGNSEEFFLSHKQRIIFWQTVTQHAHRCFPTNLHPLLEQISALFAAQNGLSRREGEEKEWKEVSDEFKEMEVRHYGKAH